MINYEYLQNWHQANENIILEGYLIRENIIDMYQRTQDIEYLEYILENVKEILRLIPLREEYFKKINYD